MSESSYAKGREYAARHTFAPCSTYLEETYHLHDPCDRHWFIEGCKIEKAVWPFSPPFDPRHRECRCRSGCNAPLLNYLLGLD